ncbi:DUF2812 domain-containing protein [Xylanibacillus composti]|uniref:DUF2812 domain-containing protein n=1 Tax=Xylanibacillus composti TaxID=1572762 RepID=A0A8J4M392_9BACL|nr:DUF2812 domain-containing protein [Xylanibacillus composti]MDT9724310.1 DUF2812 domain-containing protein [Xylanibacillus composti]GIQ69306.1 hypothetical protein XYCOK13_21300 [Xylanibacillus composti]
MRTFKFFLDFDKEEKWLEEMAQQGCQLVSKSFGYRFRAAEPERATIRIDYRTFKRQEDFIDYCTLFEDSGWQHIAGSKSSGAQYFKKVGADPNEDIFSDQLSRAGKYKRVSRMFSQLAICYFPIFVALSTTGAIDSSVLLDPRQLYLTENLWEKSGTTFLWAFLFETPFALMRGIVLLFLPVTILVYLYCAYKAKKLYDKQMNAS